MLLLEKEINYILKMTSKYKDKELLDKANALIPLEQIWSDTRELLTEIRLYSSELPCDESVLVEKLFLETLVFWFKNDFFKWYDANCPECGLPGEMLGYDPVSPGSSVGSKEVYQCTICQTMFYFERFNDPNILLTTRQGRCSEFSQVFTVMCFSVGYEARFIFDTNDHAWTEVYSHLQSRWIHCDPSEGVIDKPLMYELGWGKKPKLIMSFSPTMEIQDVTWRYSQDHRGVISRRESYTNDLILQIVTKHQKLIFEKCSPLKRRYLFKRIIGELAEFLTEPKSAEAYTGRVSGPLEWREQRGEVENSILKIGYTFKLPQNDVKEQTKYYCMWYSANCDTYVFYCNGGMSYFRRGWQTCTYSSKNIMRKEELDWKQSYLARETGGKSGEITWKFDVSKSQFSINGMYVKINAFHVDSGVVEFKAYNDQNNVSFKNGAEFNCFRLSPEKKLTVKIILSGGSSKISWQHAQIARQSMREGPVVSFGIVLFIS